MSQQSASDALFIDKGPSGRIRGLRTLLSDLTREDVLAVLPAITELITLHGYADSTDYDLVHEGHHYPPKAALGLAAERVVGFPLKASEFSGGEKSPCFNILHSLGFEIRRKNLDDITLSALDSLERFCQYERREIAEIFEPGVAFTPGAGRWGMPGIVETPKGSANFVFMVTLGKPVTTNPYQDALTADGHLLWESQTQQDFASPAIGKFLAHDALERNIHLFLRPKASGKYTYLGVLEYFSHDENKQNPVHFIWRIRNWDLGPAELTRMNLPHRDALEPTFSVTTASLVPKSVVRVEPPSKAPRRNTLGKKSAAQTKHGSVVDWAKKDLRNRQLGLSGEKLIVQYEIEALKKAEREDLARMVRHQALYDSSAGFDIASFTSDGRPKRIEVKTTQGPATTPFYISINEVLASREYGDSYSIYRVFEHDVMGESTKFFELKGDVEFSCDLDAVSFRAYPVQAKS